MEARERLELAREVETEDDEVRAPDGGSCLDVLTGQDHLTLGAQMGFDVPVLKVDPQAATRLGVRVVLPGEPDGLSVGDRRLAKPALLVTLGGRELVLVQRVGTRDEDATTSGVRQVEEMEELPPLQILLERQELADQWSSHALQATVLLREHVHELEGLTGHLLPLNGSTFPDWEHRNISQKL